MKRQNYMPSSSGFARSTRLPRAPLPYNLPSKRREAGASVATGGIAATGAKWASAPRPSSSEADDARHTVKNDEQQPSQKTAWGGAGLRSARSTSDFPNLTKQPQQQQQQQQTAPASVSDHHQQRLPQSSSFSSSSSSGQQQQQQQNDISTSSNNGQSNASKPDPVVNTGASSKSENQTQNTKATSPVIQKKDDDDDDDDDWADDSNTMDFLSDPVPLTDLPVSENRTSSTSSPVLLSARSSSSETRPSSDRSPKPSTDLLLRTSQPRSDIDPPPPPRRMPPSQLLSSAVQPRESTISHASHPYSSQSQSDPRQQPPQQQQQQQQHSRPPRHPHFPPPAAHWTINNNQSNLRPASSFTNHSRDPLPAQFTTSELRAIQEQSELMRTKAEHAKEARQRQEEERERLQKERSARKLRELEERMRLKKEREAKEKAASAPSLVVKPAVSPPVSKPVAVSSANTPKVSTNLLAKSAVSAAPVPPTTRPKLSVPVSSHVSAPVIVPASAPAKVTPNVPAKTTPNVSAKVTPVVPAKVTPNAPTKVIPNPSARVAPNASVKVTPNAPANGSTNVSSGVPTNAPTKASASAPTTASTNVSGTAPTNTISKAPVTAPANAYASLSSNASNNSVVFNASAKASNIETELSSAATLSQSQLSTPNISVDGIESSVSSSPRVVLQRPKTVPPSMSQESSLYNVSNRHSGVGRGAPRDHGPQRRYRNAPAYRGNTHHTPRSNNYESKSGPLQQHQRHPRRSSAAQSSASRNYDGPIDHETRDEWLERRRKQTETRAAVRSIIETIIYRAVNGGRSPPRRSAQHQHNQRRGGSGASLNRRERGRGSGPHGLRHSSGRGDYGLRDNERGRFGQGLRPQGLRTNMPKAMVHGPNLPLGRGRPLIPVVHSPSNLLKPLIESLRRSDLLSQRAEVQSPSKVASTIDSPSQSAAPPSPQLLSPTDHINSKSAMKDSVPETEASSRATVNHQSQRTPSTSSEPAEPTEKAQLVQSNDAAETASAVKSPSETSKPPPADSPKPPTGHESPQSISQPNERSRPLGPGSSRPSHPGRPHHASRRPNDSRRPYSSRFANRSTSQQGYVQRHRPGIPRNERNHAGTSEHMTGNSQDASAASNENPVVHAGQSNGSDDNYKTEVADENSQLAPLQALDETPRKKQPAPAPTRLAPWAGKTQAKPVQTVGMSPMAASRAKQIGQAAPHDNTLQSSTEETQESAAIMTVNTNSTLADESTQPVGSPSSDLTSSQVPLPSTGIDSHLVSSPAQAMEAKVKSVKIPPSLGGNVKVLMNPNTRRESGNNNLPNGYRRSSVIMDVDQLRPNGPNPTHGTGLGGGGGNHVPNKHGDSRNSRNVQSSNVKAASEQMQTDIPDSVNVTNLDGNGPGVDAGDATSMFGPTLSSLGLLNGREDSLAWFSSGGPPSAAPSFDAIKRAFSNQSSHYPIVDAPLIPQIPAVSADPSDSTSPVVSPARAEAVNDGKQNSWGSKLWNNDKNGLNWSKPWAKMNANTGEAHANNRNNSPVSTETLAKPSDAKLSTPRTGNEIASASTASETLPISTERQGDVNVANVENQKNSRPASSNVDERQQSRDTSTGNRGRGNRRNMRSGGNRRGMRRNGPIPNSGHGNRDRDSSRQPHDGYRGRRNPRDRNDSGDRRRGANFMRPHGSQTERHGRQVGSENLRSENKDSNISAVSTNVSNTQSSVQEFSQARNTSTGTPASNMQASSEPGTPASNMQASSEPANTLDSPARQSQTPSSTAEVEPSPRQQQGEVEVNTAPKTSGLKTRSTETVSKEQVSNPVVNSLIHKTNTPDAISTARSEVKTAPVQSEAPSNPAVQSKSGSGNGFFSGGPRGGAPWSRNKTVPASYNPRGRRPARSGPRSSRRRDHPIREQTSPSASTGSVPTTAPTGEVNLETEKRPVAQHVQNKPVTTEAEQQPQRKESTSTPSFKPMSPDGASPRSVEDMKDQMDDNEINNGSRNVSNNDISNNDSSSKATGDEVAHRGSHYGSHKPRRGGRGRGYAHQNHRHHHHPRQYTRNNDTAMDRGNGQVDSHGPTSPSSVANVEGGRQVDQVVSAANQNMAAANHVDTTSRYTASQKMVNTGDAVSKTDNGMNGSSTQSQSPHEHGRNQLAQSRSNGTARSSKEETNDRIKTDVSVAASGSSSTSGSGNRASVSLSVGADGVMNFNVNNGTTTNATRSGTGPSANAAVNENDNSANGPPGPQDPRGVDSKRVATPPAENADSGESASVTARRGRGRGGRGGRGRGRRGGGGGNSGVNGGETGNNQGGGNGRGRPYRGRSGHRGRGGRGGGFGNDSRVPAQST